MNRSKQHHYVAQWYQRGFLPTGVNQFHYLDLHPDSVRILGGKSYRRRDLLRWGPERCFSQQDLYTIALGPYASDAMERYLFGKIDNDGACALPVVLTGDWNKGHKHFQNFLSYLDAQKLRTPKGLDYIASTFPSYVVKGLARHQIALEIMHRLRQIHCTIWTECVWEIVSATSSSVKFILSDHPVVTYNHAILPGQKPCQYPSDPGIELVGTRTIFPLNLDHCLIMTNREYALKPDSVDPLAVRINARAFATSVFHLLGIIRDRSLTNDDVLKINWLIKERSRRYIASAEREWLYPERYIRRKYWPSCDALLRPPRNQVQDTKSIVWGYANGKMGGMDPYGRPLPPEEFEEMKRFTERLKRTPPGSRHLAD